MSPELLLLPHPHMVNPSAKKTIIAICLLTLPSYKENPSRVNPEVGLELPG